MTRNYSLILLIPTSSFSKKNVLLSKKLYFFTSRITADEYHIGSVALVYVSENLHWYLALNNIEEKPPLKFTTPYRSAY